MMTVEPRIYTDPACETSWATEPILRLLRWEFGEQLSPRWVMSGLARTIAPADRSARLFCERKRLDHAEALIGEAGPA